MPSKTGNSEHALADQDFLSSLSVQEAASGAPTIGVMANDFFVHDAFCSECGRFEVDPFENYGIRPEHAQALSALNLTLDQAVQDAINAACATIQKDLGVASGDFAGHHFSDDALSAGLRASIAQYLLAQAQAQPQASIQKLCADLAAQDGKPSPRMSTP